MFVKLTPDKGQPIYTRPEHIALMHPSNTEHELCNPQPSAVSGSFRCLGCHDNPKGQE